MGTYLKVPLCPPYLGSFRHYVSQCHWRYDDSDQCVILCHWRMTVV